MNATKKTADAPASSRSLFAGRTACGMRTVRCHHSSIRAAAARTLLPQRRNLPARILPSPHSLLLAQHSTSVMVTTRTVEEALPQPCSQRTARQTRPAVRCTLLWTSAAHLPEHPPLRLPTNLRRSTTTSSPSTSGISYRTSPGTRVLAAFGQHAGTPEARIAPTMCQAPSLRNRRTCPQGGGAALATLHKPLPSRGLPYAATALLQSHTQRAPPQLLHMAPRSSHQCTTRGVNLMKQSAAEGKHRKDTDRKPALR